MSGRDGEISIPDSSATFRLRATTDQDLEAISEIEAASFPDPWSRAGITSMLGTPTNRTWVAIGTEEAESGPIEGFISLRLQPPEAEILRLAVRPAARRRGIGAKLLRHALARASHSGVSTIYLEVRARNEAALALYREHGFQLSAVRRHYYSNGADALVLARTERPSRADRG